MVDRIEAFQLFDSGQDLLISGILQDDFGEALTSSCHRGSDGHKTHHDGLCLCPCMWSAC